MSKKKVDPNPQRELTLLGHLDELRVRLIICFATLFAAIIGSFFFASPVLEFLIRPVTETLTPPKLTPETTIPSTLTLVVHPDGRIQARRPEQLTNAQTLQSLEIVALSEDNSTSRTFALIRPPESPSKIIYPSPLDPFMMLFKVAIIMGILVSLLVWVWQIWLFVAPGLTDNEKKVIRPMLVGAIFLFPLGAVFAYYMIFLIIRIMQGYIVPGIDILYNATNYLKLMTTMMIVFGFIFEMPLVMAMLARVGIVTPAFLLHYRRHIWVGLAAAAMILTPPDPLSMLAVFFPLVLLFEISVLIARPMALLRARAEARFDRELESP
jgi:sec-independent protein translocase protein TatC